MKTQWSIGIIAGLLLAVSSNASAAGATDVTAPVVQYFAKRGGTTLKAIVHRPEGWRPRALLPAVVIFHGLGWTKGEPEWGETYAQHYASLGLVGICPQYRVAKGTITPLDSMADARDAIRWIRANSFALGIDPKRIAVHGLSTGAHLAISAAMFGGHAAPSSVPNAMILYSPAVDLENDPRIQPLLAGEKTPIAEISPLPNVRAGLPPMLIVQGDADTVTPFETAKAFCTKLTEAGNRCDFHRYRFVGHLFTPDAIADDKTPKPNPKVEEAALARADAFLMSLGYIKK